MENITVGLDKGMQTSLAQRKPIPKEIENMLTCSEYHLYAIDLTGEVTALGSDAFNMMQPDKLTDIKSITVSVHDTCQVFCLKNDGTVLWFGSDYCPNETNKTKYWRNIACVSVDMESCKVSAGLTNDGKVVFSADSGYSVRQWSDIKQLVCGGETVFGLRTDGTVCYALGNYSENFRDSFRRVKEWKNVKKICASGSNVYALREDGTVLYAFEQRNSCPNPYEDWRDIIDIAFSNHHLVGLKNDGTVIEDGIGKRRGCPDYGDSTKWTNISKIYSTFSLTVGLTADGRVKVHTSDNSYKLSEAEKWEDIIHIACSDENIFGLTSYGEVMFCGNPKYIKRSEVEALKLFSNVDYLEEDRLLMIEKKNREAQEKEEELNRMRRGLCRHCGGEFKGLLSKKCSICGCKKDY